MRTNDRKPIPLKGIMLRRAGESLEEQIATIRVKIRELAFVTGAVAAAAMYEIIGYAWKIPRRPDVLFALAVVVGVYFIIRVRGYERQIARNKAGIKGEREVGQVLDQLMLDGFAVFHDLQGPNFNIDHIVISKHGLFAVETKNDAKTGNGRITFDGEKVTLDGQPPYEGPVEQAIRNADWLRVNLVEPSIERRVAVTPVLLYPHWYSEDNASHRVWVLHPGQLRYHVRRLKEVLSDQEVRDLALRLSWRYPAIRNFSGDKQKATP
jgi:hypothetical protein